MNPMIENYNYWHDPRVLNSMVNRGKIVEDEKGNHFLEVEVDDSTEEECATIKLRLKCCYEVCGQCRGKGKTVNPSIDCCGITASDFDEDPDFAEDYMSGMYDVTCSECKGLRVVPVVDPNNNKPEDIKRYNDHMESEWSYARESADERAMGA